MKVLSIGSDRKIFEEGSAVQARAIEYAGLFEELHVIVFSQKFSHFKTFQLAANAWVYPTNSRSRWFYVFDAIRLGRSILARGLKPQAGSWILDSQDPFECGLAAYRVSKEFRTPLHVQIHVDFLSPYFASLSVLNRIRVIIAKHILPKASGIRVVSRRLASSLADSGLKLRVSPAVLPVFVDVKKIQNIPAAADLHKKYPQFEKIILAVSRFSEEKNLSFALKIFKEVLKTKPKLGFVIVGDGPERRNLQLTTDNLKLSGKVVFESWQGDVISYFKSADLFIQTPLYEGYGMSLVEAIASGVPAVSSDAGVAREILEGDNLSFVCPVNDAGCFSEKVKEIVSSPGVKEFFTTKVKRRLAAVTAESKDAYLKAYSHSLEEAARTPSI